MRILLCANDFPPAVGGIQTYSYQVAKNLSALGEEVIVLAPHIKGDQGFDCRQSFKVIRIRQKIYLYFIFLYALLRFRTDKILITQRADYAALAFWANLVLRVPYFIVVHGGEILLAGRRKSIRKHFRRAEKIIAVSNFTAQEIVKIGIPKEKVTVIPDGVDPEKFKPGLNSATVETRHNLSDKKVILTVSHLVKRKGHANVIRALPSVLEKVPQAIYLIVGRGAEEDNLRKLAQASGILDSVVFAGYVPDEELPLYYNACHVFIMPSYEIKEEGDVEGFGIVFLEANACGKPVIGGRSGGVVDAVIDGETGLLVDPLNTEEISTALVRLLTDESLAKRLGQRGRKRVENELNWQKVAEKIREIMHEEEAKKK